MDSIQLILLALRQWIERMKEIFFFINTQFLPVTDENEHKDHHKHEFD